MSSVNNSTFTSGGPLVRLGKCCLGIPDEPTDVNIRRVLDFMEQAAHVRWVTRNLAEIERLRGTPGEPVPVKEGMFTTKLRWLDSYLEVDMTSTSSTNGLVYVIGPTNAHLSDD